MLYKKNNQKTLSKDLFKNPTCEYRGAPFWSWNCKLDEVTLRKQIGYLKEMGFGGFHMHSRVGMASEYLGEEFMHMVSSCVDEAKKRDMLAWLYDEDKWPSGFAGGLVTKDPKYVQRIAIFTTEGAKLPEGVDLTEIADKETAIAEGKSYVLGCYDIILNDKGELQSHKQIGIDDNAEGTKWTVYCITRPKSGWFNGLTYVDTLNKEAIDKFIEVTHERYKEVVGDEFGKAVPAIFTDEPQFIAKSTLKFATSTDECVLMPWTPKLPELFSEHTGMDIFEKMPELLWDLPNGEVSRFRYLYHDFITELFTTAFSDNIGAWCENNGIMLTGHVLHEDTLQSQTNSIGEAMRTYRGFQLPGIDTLCDGTTNLFNCAKQAQSASHQYGKEGMLSELYGVTNWDFDFRHHKLQGDWEAALGVTVRVPHLSWVSMAGEAKRDYPASINYQSPWYKEYNYIEDHFARVNTALTRGKADVKVGVIHPIESYWLHWGASENTSDIRSTLDNRFSDLCQWLLFGTIDFDYICESTLHSLYSGSSNGKFNIGAMGYTAVIVPALETIRQTTVDALSEFAKSGGKVIFAGSCPKYVDAVVSDNAQKLYAQSTHTAFEKLDILNALSDVRDIEIHTDKGTKTDSLIYNMREDNDCKWLFVAHGDKTYGKKIAFAGFNDINSPIPENVIIKIKGEYTPVLYDTLSGEITDIRHEYKNGCTLVYHSMYTESSLLLKLIPGCDNVYMPVDEKKEIKTIILKGKHNYELEEPNVLLLDTAEFALDGGEFEPEDEILRLDTECRTRLGIEAKNLMPQPWVFDDKDSGHTLTLRFTINSEIDVDGALLALEDAEKHEITFNGEAIVPKIEGYFTDEAIKTFKLPRINAGANILTIKMKLSIRSNTEWCYILGDFGVKVEGSEKTIINRAQQIGYSPLKMQTMPFYGGNITYKNEIETPDCDLLIKAPFYRGATVKVFVDGKDCGYISLAPCSVKVDNVPAGKHTIEFKLFGNRYNSFAALHNTVSSMEWFGPEI
ncbi:MAG: hypothetical protein IJ365_07480, partial [Clostridia bacterium]|nr:hypothetical protein [Clostridia bacterium]